MAQAANTDDFQNWHRSCAMRCNNRAWELAVQARSPAEDREMLTGAHAAAWHWGQVGTELNRMRATTLLAEVHALLGMGPWAFTLAGEMRDYFLGRDTPDWEVALTHTIYAHAAYAMGMADEHRAAYRQAVAAINAIADEEDRGIVTKTFNQVPAP